MHANFCDKNNINIYFFIIIKGVLEVYRHNKMTVISLTKKLLNYFMMKPILELSQ